MKLKKTIILAVLLCLFIVGGNTGYATSGACSSHEGVDCSAGADWDGSVICNDNWRDSSVLFSSMEMCNSEDEIDIVQMAVETSLLATENALDFYIANGSGSCQGIELSIGLLDDAIWANSLGIDFLKQTPDYESYDFLLYDLEAYELANSNLNSTKETIYNSYYAPLCLVAYEEELSCGNNSYSTDDGDCICEEGYVWESEDVNDLDCVEGLNKVYAYEQFSDIYLASPNHEAITYLYNEGVISGYSDGTFKPFNDVNRAELLKILVEGKGLSPLVGDYQNCFIDVVDDWYAPYVCYAKEEGWVDGYSDGTFKPSQTVNKVEALKMLINSQGILFSEDVEQTPFDDVSTSDWYAPYVSKAKELGILEETGSLLEPSGGMKRAGICENLYRLITIVSLEG